MECTEHRSAVLVVGAGLAGTCAAVSAAQTLGAHASVVLASKGPCFSGSSFFEGTWGLGLVGPAGADDEEDLVQTILRIGCGVARENLVRSFVAGINPAIEQLKQWGVAFKTAQGGTSSQREFIPCFDHKHRNWNGIERQPYNDAMSRQLDDAGVKRFEGWELLDIQLNGEGGGTATFYDSGRDAFSHVHFEAIVLACGGTSSLYTRNLTRKDCLATVHGLAEQLGCALMNLEFLQFMPSIVYPVQGVVFNEKTFRYMKLSPQDIQQLGGDERAADLLDMRSMYGPFTSRLQSCAVDFCIQQAGEAGLALQPQFDRIDPLPEFVRVYQSWLQESMQVGPHDELRICLYAHASNGGIAIDEQARTSVSGVFAAGECTGGMHGADRLGGLSSANGLVFGLRAGKSSALWAQSHPNASAASPVRNDWMHFACAQADQVEGMLRNALDENGGIMRSAHGLQQALCQLDQAEDMLSHKKASSDARRIAATQRTHLRLRSARLMLQAMLDRTASAGSHYRIS